MVTVGDPVSIVVLPPEAVTDGPVRQRSVPTLRSRAGGVAVELALFVAVAVVVYIVEYFLEGPVGHIGPSTPWIAFWVVAAWNGWSVAGAHTPQGAVVGHQIADRHSNPAPVLTILARQLLRTAFLYGIPFLVLDKNLGVFLVLGGLAGLYLRFSPGHRAPWDQLAGTTVLTGFPTPASAPLEPVRSTADLRLSGKRLADERRARWLLFAAGFFGVMASAMIIWAIFSEAAKFMLADEFSWGILTGIGWFPRRGIFDLATLFVGTLWITGIAMLVAGPVGLGVAIYLSEYASPRSRRILKPLIETLASIPSVVIGLFAVSFISPQVLQPLFSGVGIFSLLAAGLGVGVLTVPIIASISEDAMRAVPSELREASYGLGSRPVTTALRVVFPSALSGITAAFIVGVSRAIGETMVVFIAAGGSGGAIFQSDPTKPGQAITAAMASLGAGTDSVAGSGIAFQSLYFLGALLFITTLLLNLVSDLIVRRFRQAY
jgi:phosphate transport system permease protein